MTTLDNILKSRDFFFANKGSSSQSYGFSSSHVWMWELDYKESWAQRNWCFWTVMLEKTVDSPLDNKEIKPVHPKGNQSWIFIGRTDAESEAPVLGHLMRRTDSLENLCWARLKAGGEWDDRSWDGWLESPIRWTWVWANSENWWWTRRSGVLQSMGSQRVGHDWATELNWAQVSFFQLKVIKFPQTVGLFLFEIFLSTTFWRESAGEKYREFYYQTEI